MPMVNFKPSVIQDLGFLDVQQAMEKLEISVLFCTCFERLDLSGSVDWSYHHFVFLNSAAFSVWANKRCYYEFII